MTLKLFIDWISKQSAASSNNDVLQAGVWVEW